jgi:hypothetical protein
VREEDPCVGAGKITRDNGRRVTTTTARVAPLRSVPAIVVAGPGAVVAGLPTATPTSRTAGSFGRALCINSIGFDQFERRHAAPRLQRGRVRLQNVPIHLAWMERHDGELAELPQRFDKIRSAAIFSRFIVT